MTTAIKKNWLQFWLLMQMLYLWGVDMWKERDKYLQPNMTISWKINYAKAPTPEEHEAAEKKKQAEFWNDVNGAERAYRAFSLRTTSKTDFLEQWIKDGEDPKYLAGLIRFGFISQRELDCAVKKWSKKDAQLV